MFFEANINVQNVLLMKKACSLETTTGFVLFSSFKKTQVFKIRKVIHYQVKISRYYFFIILPSFHTKN